MVKKLSQLSLAVLFIALLWSCNEASDISSFLDEAGQIGVIHTEIPINTTLIPGDSSQTYNDTAVAVSYFMGRLKDDYFGTTEASLHFQLAVQAEPNFAGAVLDSAVLTMVYDTSAKQYGLPGTEINAEVFQIDEDLERTTNYYTSYDVKNKPDAIGSVSGLIPNFKDSVEVPEPNGTIIDTFEYGPHLRIRVDALGNELLTLSQSDFASVNIFQDKIKGLSIRPTSNSESMVFFEMFTGLTRLNLYYTQGDTAKVLRFPVLSASSVVFDTYQHDQSGSTVEQLLESDSENDSILFVQSMQGPDLVVEITNLDSLKDRVVSIAELLIYQKVPMADDTTSYPPIQQFAVSEILADGSRKRVIDLAENTGTNIPTYFGGDYQKDGTNGMGVYSFRITRHLQSILEGESTNKMVISNFFKGSEPNRSILYGGGNHTFSAKLKVTHTDIN